MGARLARRHLLEQKNALDSVDGVSQTQKMRSTQSTAFPGPKKCARLSRRHFPEPKNVLDSVDRAAQSRNRRQENIFSQTKKRKL